MRHGKARTLLPQVLDGSLTPVTEAQVRAHAERCRRCSRALADFVTSERLLGRLPRSILADPAPEQLTSRLHGLARWAMDAEPTWAERLGATALGTAAAVMLVAVVLGGQGWQPPSQADARDATTIVAVLPDSLMTPMGRIR
jgi:anti-sigma factor RsiW